MADRADVIQQSAVTDRASAAKTKKLRALRLAKKAAKDESKERR